LARERAPARADHAREREIIAAPLRRRDQRIERRAVCARTAQPQACEADRGLVSLHAWSGARVGDLEEQRCVWLARARGLSDRATPCLGERAREARPTSRVELRLARLRRL